MADPAAWVLYEMVALIINNTVGTLVSLLRLLVQFMGSISMVMGVGLGGVVLGLLLLGVVLFFLAKFVFSSGKTIVFLIAAGVLLLLLIYMGMAIY